MVLFAPAGTSLTVPTAQPGRGQGASGHTLSLGPAPRSPSGICRRPALSSGPAPGGAARQDLEAPRCHWQWRRTAVAQRPPSRALPEPLSAGSNPGKLAAPQCVALLSYLEDRTGWDRFVLRASQIEPERSFVSTEANGRAFLACRLPTRLHCQLSCGGCICPSVRAAAAVGTSAAAVDSEQGKSNSGSEFAVVRIPFVRICITGGKSQRAGFVEAG